MACFSTRTRCKSSARNRANAAIALKLSALAPPVQLLSLELGGERFLNIFEKQTTRDS